MTVWLKGARPQTWPVSVVPVAVGTAAVAPDVIWWRALLAVVVALGLQIGVNYANDYSDGIRGTDADRVGPARLVGDGLATPHQVRLAAVVAFGVAAVVGLVLVVVVAWWLVLVGVVCILAGWFYTGGKHPYGYFGFGELFVFLFFGMVATVGTAFVQIEDISGLAVAAAVPVGLMCCAILMANNLRDLATDQQSNKLTLAVRLGSKRAVWAYVGMVVGALGSAAMLMLVRPWALLTLLGIAPVLHVVRVALTDDTKAPGSKASLLRHTARLHVVLGGLLVLALVL